MEFGQPEKLVVLLKRQVVLVFHYLQDVLVLGCLVELESHPVFAFQQGDQRSGVVERRKPGLELGSRTLEQNVLLVPLLPVQLALPEFLEPVVDEAGMEVRVHVAVQKVQRTLLLLPLHLSDVPQPEMLALLQFFLGVDVAQPEQVLPDNGYFERVLRQQVVEVRDDLLEAEFVGLQQFQQEPREILEDDEAEFPEYFGDFKGDLGVLLLPPDVVVELLREQLQVDGVLDQLDHVHFCDFAVLFEVEHHLPAVELELAALEVAAQVVLHQRQLQPLRHLLQQ